MLTRFVEAGSLGEEILAALRGTIRLQQLRLAVSQLRELLESGETDERHYQDWCSRHSWAFGNAYTNADDIRRVSRTDDIDILLPRVLTGYRDIVELKRPDHPVLRHDPGRDVYRWSSEASQAIGQCHQYMDHLHEDAAGGLRGRPEVVAYHPRATIVIGRSTDWPEAAHRALAGLNQRLVGITLMTYDHLLAQGGGAHPPLHGRGRRETTRPDRAGQRRGSAAPKPHRHNPGTTSTTTLTITTIAITLLKKMMITISLKSSIVSVIAMKTTIIVTTVAANRPSNIVARYDENAPAGECAPRPATAPTRPSTASPRPARCGSAGASRTCFKEARRGSARARVAAPPGR